jgi:hypothetical protein
MVVHTMQAVFAGTTSPKQNEAQRIGMGRIDQACAL